MFLSNWIKKSNLILIPILITKLQFCPHQYLISLKIIKHFWFSHFVLFKPRHKHHPNCPIFCPWHRWEPLTCITHYNSYSSWQFMVNIPHIKFVSHEFIDFSRNPIYKFMVYFNIKFTGSWIRLCSYSWVDLIYS